MRAKPPKPPSTGLRAVLAVRGAGYKVCVLVNGADVGVRVGDCEDRELLSRRHPLSHRVPKEDRARTVVLKDGPNQIVVNFKKSEAAAERLTVELFMEHPTPVFSLTTSSRIHGKLNRTLNLKNGSVMTMTDADLRS